jgi:hemoglobin/transferrin/lactoferrin receptor protein
MKKIWGLSLLLGLGFPAFAQTDTLAERAMEEVILYANKFAERKKYIVQKVEVIAAGRIAQMNTPSMAELLQSTGNVFVQKSQMGGGSPVLRGFEASRVLLVVDGIRMNNAIYRAGHLQSAITVDQNMLERVEVLYGPASTLYGSDALGGAVLFRSKAPQLSTTGKTAFSGTAFARYGSAANELSIHADASIGGRRWAWLQSYTVSDFNDLRMGEKYPGKYPNFGRRSQYVARINGMDSIVQNRDDRVQRYSGYSQMDITQKLLFQQTERVSHSLNLQWSNSSDIPRYDRLQDVRNGSLRYAEWYYGPQQRGLAAYELNIAQAGFFNNLRAIASYQRLKESRHQRSYRSTSRDNRFEYLDVVQVVVDGKKFWKQHELTTGIDAQLNWLQSEANKENINTGVKSPLDSRYPNGDNRFHNVGIYAQHLAKWRGGKWVLNDGLRLQAVSLRSTIADNSFFGFPFTSITQKNIAVTGNVGLAYLPTERSRFTAGVASGFRAPNIDDAARVFETAANQLIVPNNNIEPEYTYTFDLGIQQRLGNKVRFEANVFYTLMRNAIALAPYALNGKQTATYNGAQVPLFANQNVNKAALHGAQAALTINFTDAIAFTSTLTYTNGELKDAAKGTIPMDHIPPVYGKTALTATHGRLRAEVFALYNGWKRAEDYNPNGEDNLQYATPDGMPAWTTLNLNTGYDISDRLLLQANMENILDRNYRVFASGFSAPGRNVVVALRVKM